MCLECAFRFTIHHKETKRSKGDPTSSRIKKLCFSWALKFTYDDKYLKFLFTVKAQGKGPSEYFSEIMFEFRGGLSKDWLKKNYLE